MQITGLSTGLPLFVTQQLGAKPETSQAAQRCRPARPRPGRGVGWVSEAHILYMESN